MSDPLVPATSLPRSSKICGQGYPELVRLFFCFFVLVFTAVVEE